MKHKATKGAEGTWRAEDVLLPLHGKWKIRVDILITDFEIAKIEGGVGVGSAKLPF